MNETQLIKAITKYFEEEIVQKHQENIVKEHSKLENYQFNPILIKYLSQLKENKISPEGIAKALFYPRALGTSIAGSFGTKFQNMLVELGVVDGSLIDGMDVEFIDKTDKRKKYCQLKSGPNTINSKDVKPILDEFDKVVNLARTNSFKKFNNNDLILGILYGERSQLSDHYLKIDQRYPVIIGTEFWYRVTGFPKIYEKLIKAIDKLIVSMPSSNDFQKALNNLVLEIKASKIV